MSNTASDGSSCGAAPKLIFPCSGAADVGEVSDRVARLLTRQGAGKMFCLAGVGAHIADMLRTVQSAGTIVAIDGCPKDCVRQTLAHAGFEQIAHVRLTDIGLQKGASPATDVLVAQVAEQVKPLLA